MILIIGITGGCRGGDSLKVKFTDLENEGTFMVMKIPDTEMSLPRLFLIEAKYAEIAILMQRTHSRSISSKNFNKFIMKHCVLSEN